MSSECRECRRDPSGELQHCHGTVIHHTRHRSECTEVDCRAPEAVHTFAVDCGAIGCPCGMVAPATARGA